MREKYSTYYIRNIILWRIKVLKLADSWRVLRFHTGCVCSWSSWRNPPFPTQSPRSSWPASSPCLGKFHSQRRAHNDSEMCYCRNWNKKWNDKALKWPYRQIFFPIWSYISCNELLRQNVSIWIKNDFLWSFKNLKILFYCGLPVPLITSSTCSELWRRFRNVWLQAWLISLVLPL